MSSTKQSQRCSRLTRTFLFVLILSLVSALLPFNLSTAFAVPTSAEVQAQADEARAALAAAEEQMRQIGEDYRAAAEARDAATAAMEEAQARIDAAEEVIKDTQERLGIRANQMYRDGQLSYLEVLFGASSFEAFTAGWDIINTVNEQSAQLIQANRDARAEAEAAREEYELQQQAAEARLAEVETLKAKAEELVAERQAILAGLDAEIAALIEQEETESLAVEAASNPATGTYQGADVPVGGYGDVVSAAASRVGCPYVSGGSGPNEFDCSGLTSWAYQQAGRGWIGRTDSAQRGNGTQVSWSDAQPGDVLWWVGHVAIYAGDGYYIHAANPVQGVCYSNWDIENAVVLRF